LATSDGFQTASAGTQTQGRIFGGSCGSGSSCVLVGELGTVVPASDGTLGTPERLPSGVDLSSASCPSSGVCYAVGHYGAILKSADGGGSWTRSGADRAATNLRTRLHGYVGGSTIGSLDLAATSCANSTVCVSVGALGAILSTADTGASWSPQGGLGAPGSNPFSLPLGPSDFVTYAPATIPESTSGHPLGSFAPLDAVSCPSTHSCVAVGELGKVATTSDLDHDGGSWSIQKVNGVSTLSGVSCPKASSTCFAVGDYGAVLKSTDSGSSWKAQDSGTSTFLNGVSCADDTHCAAVGAQGLLLATDDGTTWHAASSPTSAYLGSVSCPRVTSCVAVGSGGTVLGSDDGGRTWSARSAPSADDLYGVSCSTASRCVVTGSAGTVASTADGGQSWNVQGSGTTDALRGVDCPDSGSCFAAGENGALLKIGPNPPSGGNGPPSEGGGPGAGGLGDLGGLLTGVTCQAKALQSEILGRGLRLTRRIVQISGRSRTRQCRQDRVTHVRVAIARTLRRGRCQFLGANGRLGRTRLCSRPVYQFARVRYVASRLVTDWTFSRRVVLPPGRYRIQVRGQDRIGLLEPGVVSRPALVSARSR
jgi:photosystem II stability/assembly factor-like uncharacterized protein